VTGTTVQDTAPRLMPLAVYTSEEAASILRVSIRKLREMTQAGELHALPYATGKLLFAGHELARCIGVAS
jgi:Helix-turn-helix domain